MYVYAIMIFWDVGCGSDVASLVLVLVLVVWLVVRRF